MTDLATLARAAGITDPSAIDLADTTIATPQAQLADLKARYPAIFPKPVRGMSPDEFRAARAAAVKPQPKALRDIAGGKHVSEMTEPEYRRARADLGGRRSFPRGQI
jgi:acyl transferase domain-containing protein